MVAQRKDAHSPPGGKTRCWQSPGRPVSRRTRMKERWPFCHGTALIHVMCHRTQDRNLLIDTQHFSHLVFKCRVVPLQVVAHFMRLHLLLGENVETVPCAIRARQTCPAPGACSRAWRAGNRVVQSSCGYPTSFAFWQASDTSHARASSVISGSLPGRGLSSSAAITPNRLPRARQRWTVFCVTPTVIPTPGARRIVPVARQDPRALHPARRLRPRARID